MNSKNNNNKKKKTSEADVQHWISATASTGKIEYKYLRAMGDTWKNKTNPHTNNNIESGVYRMA